MEKATVKMSALDQALAKRLDLEIESGTVDIKVHIDVSGYTKVSNIKRVLHDVLERDGCGEITSYPLKSFHSFDELLAKFDA